MTDIDAELKWAIESLGAERASDVGQRRLDLFEALATERAALQQYQTDASRKIAELNAERAADKARIAELTSVHARMERSGWMMAADIVLSYRRQGDWDDDTCAAIEAEMRDRAEGNWRPT